MKLTSVSSETVPKVSEIGVNALIRLFSNSLNDEDDDGITQIDHRQHNWFWGSSYSASTYGTLTAATSSSYASSFPSLVNTTLERFEIFPGTTSSSTSSATDNSEVLGSLLIDNVNFMANHTVAFYTERNRSARAWRDQDV